MKKSLTLSLIAVLFAAVFIVSCKDDETPSTSNDNAYKGDWSGIYEGDDEGTWAVTVAANGSITGEASSDFLPGSKFPVTGKTESNGDYEAMAIVLTDSVVFTGKFTGNNAAGTWVNNGQGISGTFSGTKK